MAAQMAVEGQLYLIPGKGKFRFTNGQFVPEVSSGGLAPITGGGSDAIRLGLGLGPATEAAKRMLQLQTTPSGKTINPIRENWQSMAAYSLGDLPLVGEYILGAAPPRYQQYRQSAKSWESSFLPILSGLNVTESEALRQMQARLPSVADTDPKVIATKTSEVRMMVNGAADLMGKPRPFPEVGVLYFGPTGGEMSSKRPATPAKGSAPAKGQIPGLPPGFVFHGEAN